MSNGLSRLLSLKQQCRDVAKEMPHESQRMRRMEGLAPTRAISSFNLFQTPEHLAERMARMLGDPGRCLEPSAGLGRLAKAVKPSSLVMVEQHQECCAELRLLGLGDVVCADFLTCDTGRLGLFDTIIMNPPFKNGTDCRHVFHALQFLKPKGHLVSLCYNGTRQNEKLKPIATTWEVLPDNTFKEEGTRASVVLFTIVNS